MKKLKCILIIFFLIVSVGAKALNSVEVSEEDYLIKHGHSDDIVRMIELQKSRIEPQEEVAEKTFWGNVLDHIKKSRLTKLVRNLIYERDMTLPLEEFGHDRVKTVETPNR